MFCFFSLTPLQLCFFFSNCILNSTGYSKIIDIFWALSILSTSLMDMDDAIFVAIFENEIIRHLNLRIKMWAGYYYYLGRKSSSSVISNLPLKFWSFIVPTWAENFIWCEDSSLKILNNTCFFYYLKGIYSMFLNKVLIIFFYYILLSHRPKLSFNLKKMGPL